MAQIWNNVWPYIVAVLLFIILIVIHEFGHFIAAKLLGVKVNEFAVGFGPKLISKKIGETLYSINLLPLGGFCAMEGEDSESESGRAFCNKRPWRRLLIVVMGAAFNLALGFVLVAISLAPGKLFSTTTVAQFDKDAKSSKWLQVDDKITHVDGRRIYSTYDLSYAFTNIEDGTVDITVERDGKKLTLKDVKFDTEELDGISYIEHDFYVYGKEKTFFNYIGETFKTSISYSAVIWRSLIDLIGGKFGISAVSGPVGLTVAISDIAKQNLRSLIPVMALISINLGLFNLAPVPALDGGRALFIIFEMIFRKPVPQKYEAIIHTVGFCILIGFMILVTFKDIWSLFAG